MGKKSAIVSGMGLGLGMLTNADQIRKKMGMTDEQFHILATDAGREYWRRLFSEMRERKADENRYETYTVTIGGYKSLKEAIKAGKYGYCSPDITSEYFLLSERGEKKNVEITLVHRNKSEQSQNLINEMDKAGYRPATHEEILAFGVQRPYLQKKFPIIALGTVVCVVGARRVLYLDECNGKRELYLGWFDRNWGQDCRFAFVRKNLNS